MVKELVELIVKALVDNPEKVQISQLDGEQTSILELAEKEICSRNNREDNLIIKKK